MHGVLPEALVDGIEVGSAGVIQGRDDDAGLGDASVGRCEAAAAVAAELRARPCPELAQGIAPARIRACPNGDSVSRPLS